MENAEQLDQYILAELPDPEEDPIGKKIVSDMMTHRPCSGENLDALCMQKGSCNKHFPKKYNNDTFFDDNGRTNYRRRDTSIHTIKNESNLDNSYVVPYNRDLCLAFQAHINIKYYGWSMLIKYLIKYISKGPDRILAKIRKPIDEASTSACNTAIEAIHTGFGKLVKDFGLLDPPPHLLEDLKNKLLMEEKNYKRELLMREKIHLVPKLNTDQIRIYDIIIDALANNQQELIFIYGHGGTGKKFL
ncbi:DNA helicase [Tanacetum coccineum]